MEITSVDSFLGYFDKVRERTLRVARCIPPERLEWRYREGTFSFGDILRHLGAIERYMFAENAALRPSRYPGHGRELADGYEAVFDYLGRMHAEAVEIFAGLSPADLRRKCVTPGGAEIAVWKWLRSMVEHEVHHRG
ncbi:MAG TPA: DinB family protein, partial [Thermoanaerobaculia bacterium]|nr:DinB family protein [Thermoanaerobaculia bacterium]